MTLLHPASLSDEQLLLGRVDAPARVALVDYWERRADGEFTTALALQHVRDDFVALNAPPALIALADSAIADEHRHTEWCLGMSARVGGRAREKARVIGDRPLTFAGASARENRVLRAVFSGCISETIALHILRESQRDILSPALRSVNRQHMAEEVGHGRLGWGFLAWSRDSGSMGRATKKCLERALPMLLRLAEDSWNAGARTAHPELAALGFLHHKHVRRGMQLARDEVMIPGFRHFDIEV